MTKLRPAGLMAGVSLFGAVLVCATAAAPGTLGCETHQCDTSFECVFPADLSPPECNGGGSVVVDGGQLFRNGDELDWFSAPFSGEWIDFAGNETLSIFYPPEIADALAPGDVPTAVYVWVSATAANASSPFRNFVSGAGQLAEIVYMDNHAVNILNATCAGYSLRIEVKAQAPADGGTDALAVAPADASVDDASVTTAADGAMDSASPAADSMTVADAGPD